MYPCGKCSLCRERMRKQWACRMESESKYNRSSFFLSLTYSDDYLPFVENSDIPTLSKLHYKNFIKLLRKKLPFTVRFYGVGEYGSVSGRPHYHFIIWCPEYINRAKFRNIVFECWKFGFNTVKDANVQRFYYIAKYCCKESTKPHFASLDGFSTCSQNPPIGYRHFIANNDIYQDFGINFMVSPSFRKSSLPRSFERRIKESLSLSPRSSLSDPAHERSLILKRNAGIRLRQNVIDYNKMNPAEFCSRRDAIVERIHDRKKHQSNKI